MKSSVRMLGLEEIGSRLIEDLSGAEAEGRHSRRPGDASSVLDPGRADLTAAPVAMRLISTRDLSLRENMGVTSPPPT